MALAFLRRRGARLVTPNRRVGRGEIDLLVTLEGKLAAVEVKTRIGIDPISQITRLKRDRMRRAAREAGASRVDIVTVRFDRAGATLRWVRGV